jgi:hypothetical protein
MIRLSLSKNSLESSGRQLVVSTVSTIYDLERIELVHLFSQQKH